MCLVALTCTAVTSGPSTWTCSTASCDNSSAMGSRCRDKPCRREVIEWMGVGMGVGGWGVLQLKKEAFLSHQKL